MQWPSVGLIKLIREMRYASAVYVYMYIHMYYEYF